MESARKYIAERTPQELRAMTRDDLIRIASSLSKEEVKIFLFEKNVKLFGGINAYVEDFLEKMSRGVPVDAKIGFISMLDSMKVYPGLSEENKVKIDNTINILKGSTAPAAGGFGFRNKKRKTRRKGLKHKYVRR